MSAWTPVPLASPLTGPALAETLDGGQCFRWSRSCDGIWSGASGAVVAELRERGNLLEARLAAGTVADLRWHLAAEVDWSELADRLPWRTDTHLAGCLAAFPGLRILRQPIGEALLGFLCSATKQIVQIKRMTEALAARFGGPFPHGPGGAATPAARSRLPSWACLAGVAEVDLRTCGLGFRARHVRGVALRLAGDPGWLDATAALPYPEAKARLMDLPGVGEKIADCVLLFGGGKLEAFPVDVWVLRAMARRYGLHGWSPAQVAHFGRVHFGPLAGLAQQFLFVWERRHGRS